MPESLMASSACRRGRSGESSPEPAFLWPMLSELKIPALVIRARESDMFAPETTEKVRAANLNIDVIELPGSYDLARDKPTGLV